MIDEINILELAEDAEKIAMAYFKAAAIPKNATEDARHVAIDTVHNLDAMVSWNFRDLVNLRRIKLVN